MLMKTNAEMCPTNCSRNQRIGGDMTDLYVLKADDVTVWEGRQMPTDGDIQNAGDNADLNGWNGTRLDLFRNGVLLDTPIWYKFGDDRRV